MKLADHASQLMLALIIGIVSFGVSYIGDIAKNTQNLAVAIQELNVRMSQVSDTMRDHEERIRVVEHNQPTYRRR